MTRYVALLRGINVGGRNRLAMATLRDAVAATGATEIATYVQSGNVVLTSTEPESAVAATVRSAITGASGLDVAVIVRSAAVWDRIVSDCPFDVASIAPTSLHLTCFDDERSAAACAGIEAAPFRPDEYAVIGREVYLHLPNGIGTSKLAVALERAGTRSGTTRNWRTVLEVQRLLAG